MRLFRRQGLDHEAAWDLLPWLAQGTLEGRDLRATLDHLKTCRACREELRFLPELRAAAAQSGPGAAPDPAAAFSRLMQRVEASEGRTQPRGSAEAFWLRMRGTPLPSVAWAGLLLILALGVGWILRPAPQEALFRVLSDGVAASASDAPRLRVVFAPETPERRLREILLGAGAVLADGPSRTGVYTLELPSGQDLEPEEMARLRALEEVSFLEPVVQDPGTSP